MSGKYQRYPAYKASGVEWLGDVPEHWTVSKLGYLINTIVPMRDKPVSLIGDIPWIRIEDFDGKYISDSKSGQGVSNQVVKDMHLKVFPVGTVLCTCSCSMGRTAIVTSPLISNQTFIGLLPNKKLYAEYLYYLMQASEAELTSKSAGAIQLYLSQDEFKALRFGFPSFEEQTKIANFLDHETAKIDTLIEKQRRLIELLKEKRQAVISHAVTKGLNPNAPMKDSGVEWLGEVPEHWEVMPLKYIVKAKKGAVKAGPFGSHLKNSDMEGSDVKVIAQKNVISKDFEIGESMISMDKYRELEVFTIERDDILVTTRGTIGRTAIYDSDIAAILHPCLIRIQVEQSQVYPELIALIIQESGYAMEQILINSNATTIEVIYSENLINTIICLPQSLVEQKLLLDYISSRKNYFSMLIGKAESAINLKQERRTALISAAVTGKIDVRHWQVSNDTKVFR